MLSQVVSLCTGRLKKFGNYDFFQNIQVLSPTKKGKLGTKELNKILQEKLNPNINNLPERTSMGAVFRAGDRVMQIKNNYDIYWEREGTGTKGGINNKEIGSGVFNGEIGTVIDVNEKEKQQFMTQYDANQPFVDVTKPYYDIAKNYDPVTKMQFVDINQWLNGDLLHNADRTTMAHSLELRTPFLDKEVFAVAREIPADLRIANNTTKYILRKAVEGIVPDHVLHRRKLGFPVPLRFWLKDELYDWAKDQILASQTDKYLDKTYMLKLLDDHRDGKADNSRKLWTVLAFMMWHKIYVENDYLPDAEEIQATAAKI